MIDSKNLSRFFNLLWNNWYFCFNILFAILGQLEMEEQVDSDHQLIMKGGFRLPHSMDIDPSRERFPCCIVWAPLPVLSWLVPFIGHVGICREDGIILDFAGPNFVCVDHFTFGPVARYLQINKDKVYNSIFQLLLPLLSLFFFSGISFIDSQTKRLQYGKII